MAAALGWLLSAPLAVAQPQLVSPDQSRFRIDGFAEWQLRGLADDFRNDRAYLSQSAFVLDLEPEWDVAPDGWGPFDRVSAFARIEVRYDCVFNGCGTIGGRRQFGHSAERSPARNWADGPTLRYVGGVDLTEVGGDVGRVQGGSLDLLPIAANPGFRPFYDIGIDPATTAAAFGPTADDLFSWKSIDGPRSSLAVPLGPWDYGATIHPNGALRNETSTVLPLPLRPEAPSLFTPSAALRGARSDFDSFDQNFSETELAWNHGASQDEGELKEAYLDLELLDSRLWVRAGKQNIVWGKTELFRTTDQFNPVDIGLASLPSLEESRVGLWSLRGVYSFYDVGPLQDVRLELAANLDDFEPIDTGRCAEPYAIWLICLKSTGLWAHGTTGVGLAGEEHPEAPWNGAEGIEAGVRFEFRWRRFSFAVTDFYGYDDIPSVELFNEYARNVDPATGRPLDVLGRPLTPDNALDYGSANRQGFDLGCKASLGFGGNALLVLTGGLGEIPDISERCIGDLVNFQDPVTIFGFEATAPNLVGALLSGQQGAQVLLTAALNTLGRSHPGLLVPLNRDPNDGPPGGGFFGPDSPVGGFIGSDLSFYLSPEQEALLGCGEFYSTDCDVDGIDFSNAEGSVLLQAFPGFEENAVATRLMNGRQVILPGARGTGDDDYNPSVDGTPPPGFDSEMQALSANFAGTIAVLGIAEGDEDCDLDDLATCAAVRALEALSGSTRPEVRAGGNGRFGRRDWQWHGGGEARIRYPKRNVLGFSSDFAEGRFLTNWAVEFTWINDATFSSNRSRSLTQEADRFNLTVSVDRPTFVNFLNPNRTFFVNSQFFFGYVPDHDSSFDVDGPFSVLGTFSVFTGYFQDRLLPALTLVHDFRSSSGGIIWQTTYRFSEVFSATVGLLAFYGTPDDNRLPEHPIALPDTQTDFKARLRYGGLSAIAERDELFLTLRYTF